MHTGLGIVQVIVTLNTRLVAQYGAQLAVRLGIHTGPVVVGVMGGGGRHEHLALGETPNIAARLEGLAPTNAVVISAVTARLVHGAFALEDLGTHTLHGVAEPMAVSRVRGVLAPLNHDEDVVTAVAPLTENPVPPAAICDMVRLELPVLESCTFCVALLPVVTFAKFTLAGESDMVYVAATPVPFKLMVEVAVCASLEGRASNHSCLTILSSVLLKTHFHARSSPPRFRNCLRKWFPYT